MSSQMGSLLVNLPTVGVVAQVHGGVPGCPVGVHAQGAPALLTLPATTSLQHSISAWTPPITW